MNGYTFANSDNVGKQATHTVFQFLTSHPNHIELVNVESDPSYQVQDIDLVWTTKLGTVTIEVKGDTYHQTGNLFLETVSNASKQTPGCFLYTAATFLIYCFITPGSGLIIPVKAAREWFLTTMHSFKERRTFTQVGSDGYETIGKLVPIQSLLRSVKGVRTFGTH